MRTSRIFPVLSLTFGLTLATGCGSNKTNGFGPPDAGPSQDASKDATSSGHDAHGGSTKDAPGVLKQKDTGGPGACGGLHCSSDLRSMVDCSGNVISTCPPDQGCYGSGCIDACTAAIDNKTNIGCEYYAVTPDALPGNLGFAGACYAAFVANTWDTPVTITADFAGMTLDVSKFAYIATGSGTATKYVLLGGNQLQAGQVAILFLNRQASGGSKPPPGDAFLSYDCPAGVTPAITAMDTAVHGTGLGSAFHITTDAPVVAYDMYPFGGGHTAVPSATLLLPTSAWDTNYIAVDAYRANTEALGSQPWIQFVAMTNGTSVTINPTAVVNAATGVAAAAIGVPATYTLNAGQVLELATGKPGINVKLPGELTGSVVQSSAPIGMWGGMNALNVIPTVRATDTGHQQIPPIRSLGSEYVAVRYRNRYPDLPDETPPWRFVGAVNGTTLTYDPSAPDGAPTTLALGQVVEFDASGPFVVRSQDSDHPFYVAAYMTGAGPFDPALEEDGGSLLPADGRGDPEFVNVIPPDEFLQSYIFFTDPTYPETNLVVVRTAGPNGFVDVALDCAGDLSGWQPIGSGGKYQYTRYDLSTGNFVGTGNCNNGRHQIKSTGSFGVTVWGWGSSETGTELTGTYTQYASYAYPAGASVAPINTVVVPAVPK